MTTMTLRVATVNAPSKVGPDGWRNCFDQVTDHGDDFAVINEAGSPRAKAIYARRARAKGLSFWGLFRGPNPVFRNPDRWDLEAARHVLLHRRGTSKLALRWPGFNGPRYATVTVNGNTTTLDAPEVVVIGTHLVPRGPKVPEWWRSRVRRRSLRKLTRIIRAHIAAGRIVVILGDFNMEDGPALPGIRWVWDHGVDKIGVAVPHGVRLTGHHASTFDADTDHGHGVAAQLTLTY